MKNQVIRKDQNSPAGTNSRIRQALIALALLVTAVTPALADDDRREAPAYTFRTFDVPGEARVSERQWRHHVLWH